MLNSRGEFRATWRCPSMTNWKMWPSIKKEQFTSPAAGGPGREKNPSFASPRFMSASYMKTWGDKIWPVWNRKLYEFYARNYRNSSPWSFPWMAMLSRGQTTNYIWDATCTTWSLILLYATQLVRKFQLISLGLLVQSNQNFCRNWATNNIGIRCLFPYRHCILCQLFMQDIHVIPSDHLMSSSSGKFALPT